MVTLSTKEKEGGFSPETATEAPPTRLEQIAREEKAAIEKIEEEIQLPQNVVGLGLTATPSPIAIPTIKIPITQTEFSKAIHLKIKDALSASVVWLACWCGRLILLATKHGKRVIFKTEESGDAK